MSEKKGKLPVHTSPRGVFHYPWLNKADTKFDKEGVYTSGLILEPGPAAKLAAQIDAEIDAKFDAQKAAMVKKGGADAAKAKKLSKRQPYGPVYDQDGEETGRVKFNFKVKATGKNDNGETWSNKPALFDSAGKPCDVAVYGGSEGKIAFQIVPYYSAKDNEVGVTLRLKAAQIIKLVSGGQKSAEGYGFGVEEDGFQGGGFSPADEDDDDDATDEDASDADDADDEDVDF